MPSHFVLVDFENVQPKNLGALSPADTHVRVFAGANQSKVDLGLAQALQPFGTRAEYVQIVGSGKDALDFHIAFYIGELSAQHPGARFTIVSRDTGFDPLIKHLASRGITCKRVASLGTPAAGKTAKSIPTASVIAKDSEQSRIEEVRERLQGLKTARPRTLKTLRSSLKAWFKPVLTESAVDALLAELQSLRLVTVDGTKVAYSLG